MNVDGIKRLNFNVPQETYDEFIKIFPYRGELTAFFNRCMQTAVLVRKRKLSQDEMEATIARVQEEV